MVDQLLAGGPEDHEIAGAGKVAGDGHDAEEHGGEGKRQAEDDRNGKLNIVSAGLDDGIVRTAWHDRYSKFFRGLKVRAASDREPAWQLPEFIDKRSRYGRHVNGNHR